MKKPKGVLFDFGSTIVDASDRDWIGTSRKLLEFAENTPAVTPEELQVLSDELFHEWEQTRIDSMLEFPTTAHYRLLLDTLGISLSISFDQVAKIVWDTFTLFLEEGIEEMLATLKGHRIRTGVVSNCTENGYLIERTLQNLGVADAFSFVLSSGDYGIRKPHPRLFKLAERKIGLEPEDIWFVGDKPEMDVKGALAAGMVPVWYNRQGKPSDHGYECLEVKSWNEFAGVVSSL